MRSYKLEDITSKGLQIRCRLSEETIRDYMEAVEGGAVLPPVILFNEGPGRPLYLADGFHRVEVARRLAQKTIRAEVREGGYAEALAFALGANSSHGLRRTNEDKRNAVRVAWENRKMLFGVDNPSAGSVAEACGVSQAFVSDQLKTVLTCAPKKVVGKDGKEYQIPPPPTRPPTPMRQAVTPPPPPPPPPREPATPVADWKEIEKDPDAFALEPPPPAPRRPAAGAHAAVRGAGRERQGDSAGDPRRLEPQADSHGPRAAGAVHPARRPRRLRRTGHALRRVRRRTVRDL